MTRENYKTKEYFDTYIEKKENELKDLIELLSDERVIEEKLYLLHGMISENRLFTIIAKYSRGDSIHDLVKEYKQLVPLWLKACCLESVEAGYEQDLWFVSLAILLEIDEETKNIIRKRLKDLNINDWLLNFLLSDSNEEAELIEGELLVPERYENLKRVICLSDKTLLIHYLEKEWYANCKDYGWYDSHKQRRHRENLYFGYWCFEAGAVVKLLNWDDSDIANQQYYPYELVHYKK